MVNEDLLPSSKIRKSLTGNMNVINIGLIEVMHMTSHKSAQARMVALLKGPSPSINMCVASYIQQTLTFAGPASCSYIFLQNTKNILPVMMFARALTRLTATSWEPVRGSKMRQY